jgi:hypothetical protein
VTTLLRAAGERRLYVGGPVWMPLLRARLRRGVLSTVAIDALVDSGAAYTLANLALAAELGLDAASLGACPKVRVQGLGGPVEECPQIRCDLVLGSGEPATRLVLRDAAVLFTASALPIANILLGQVDALRRLEFVQRNQDPRPELVLKLPR